MRQSQLGTELRESVPARGKGTYEGCGGTTVRGVQEPEIKPRLWWPQDKSSTLCEMTCEGVRA